MTKMTPSFKNQFQKSQMTWKFAIAGYGQLTLAGILNSI
jgi:hypothetical protein